MKIYTTLCCLLLTVHCTAQDNPSTDIPTIDWEALQKTKPWVDSEVWEPVPPVVTAEAGQIPSDAVVLFDGSNLDQWQKPQFGFEGANMEQITAIIKNLDPAHQGAAADWDLENGAMVVKPGTGAIESKPKFGDMQMHIEWLSPLDEGKEGQGYSNSGIFIMSFYELQILNNYQNKTYPNGQAGSIYKQHIPLVNASRTPGTWQSYDIVFKAPRFENGTLKSPARITVFHNGVLVQNHVELKGPTAYIGQPHYSAHPDKLPIRLQDHGDKVRFRNIWVREL